MKKFFTIAIALVLAFGVNISIASSDAPPLRLLKDMTVSELISHYSQLYAVSENRMIDTIKCESQFNETVQSYAINPKTGNRENSWGLAQINLDYNPTVTKAEATNKVFAVRFLAQGFKAGHADRWSCYRQQYMV